MLKMSFVSTGPVSNYILFFCTFLLFILTQNSYNLDFQFGGDMPGVHLVLYMSVYNQN